MVLARSPATVTAAPSPDSSLPEDGCLWHSVSVLKPVNRSGGRTHLTGWPKPKRLLLHYLRRSSKPPASASPSRSSACKTISFTSFRVTSGRRYMFVNRLARAHPLTVKTRQLSGPFGYLSPRNGHIATDDIASPHSMGMTPKASLLMCNCLS